MIDHYDWAGGREAMLRFGPANGPVVVAAMPLFEEANRTRALVVAILRQLASRAIASALPDLPGMGESSVDIEETSLPDWQMAFSSAVIALRTTYDSVHVLSFRGGALIGGAAAATSHWSLSPLDGATVVRDLGRVKLAASKEAGISFDPTTITAPGAAIEIAGHQLNPALLAELGCATLTATSPARTVRLETDPLSADRHVTAIPLWRRSEPDSDIALAAVLADDIAVWIATCGG